jgi:GTP-binding protein
MQRQWGEAMAEYLQQRRSLRGVFLLMDIRHPLTEFDRQLLDWCHQRRLPAHIALTKADKLSRGAAKTELLKLQAVTARSGAPDITVQLFSALDGTGIDEAHRLLDRWLQAGTEEAFEPPPPAPAALL